MKTFKALCLGAIAVASTFAAPVMAREPNWQIASESQDNTGKWYYDANFVKRADSFVTTILWLRDANGSDTLFATEIDCSDYTFRFTGMKGWDGRDRYLGSDYSTSEWKYAPRNSNIAYVMGAVC